MAKLDPSHLVFIDESGAKTNMTRLRGRALGGNRLFAKTPHGHWYTTTLISSVRLDGTTAAMEGEGATDTAVFGEYIRRVFLPTLSPEDIVIMDNLRVHHNPKVIELIESYGYAPIFAYVGTQGHMPECELRPGKQHCQSGTTAFIARSVETLQTLGLGGNVCFGLIVATLRPITSTLLGIIISS